MQSGETACVTPLRRLKGWRTVIWPRPEINNEAWPPARTTGRAGAERALARSGARAGTHLNLEAIGQPGALDALQQRRDDGGKLAHEPVALLHLPGKIGVQRLLHRI